MSRRTGRELELADFARRHQWSELIAEHDQREVDVMSAVGRLLREPPGRRRVRAMELAALIDERLPADTDQQRALHGHLSASLRADNRWSFVLSGLARLGPGRPILLTATPRTGNSLVQELLREGLGFPVMAAQSIEDIDPDQVDAPVLLQIHAPRDRVAESFVAELEARVVTVARHPLDVLVSILHFARHEPQVLDWLDGAAIASAQTLADATPVSAQFVDWACGKGASRLLAITHDWWEQPKVCRVRYEELIEDPRKTMARLLEDLALGPELELEERLASAEVERIASNALTGKANHHRWRSKAGGWRDFLPPAVAQEIHRAHRRVFDDLGYEIDPVAIGEDEALANWWANKR